MGAWQWVLYLHVLAMTFFVGGQLVIAAVLVPLVRQDPAPERMRVIGRRFGVGSLIALVVLLVTGAALASHLELWSSTTLQLKLGLVATLIVLAVLHLRHPRMQAIQAGILLISLAVVWLGLDLTV